MRFYKSVSMCICCLLAFGASTASSAQEFANADEAMDSIVSRLYASRSVDELAALTEDEILEFIMPSERHALATGHVQFDTDVPVVVSVMRETGQPTLPFWLPEAGFKKTGMTVVNTEGWVYEVWQKEFPAGHVGLGVNGFDKHRPHYFVSVGPQETGVDVMLSNVYPAEFHVDRMRESAFVYHDWDSLLLKDVPEELEGQHLLTTIRGRARAAHLIGGFRQTPYPATTTPDQIALSWTEDPITTQTVQWRGSTSVEKGAVRFRLTDSNDPFQTVEAERSLVEDRFLANDRYCHKFAATMRNLQPATTYTYQTGFPERNAWSEPATFTTAPADDAPFTFIVYGDTQSIEPWGPTASAALAQVPNAAFQMIAGDVVNTGQYRDEWDRFFHVGQPSTKRWPLMPALGNHDVIDGLGSRMWQASHALPKNGPAHLESERVYSFEYSNALVLVLDSGLAAIDQAEWIENTLANSDATWKFAIYHFPPYNSEHPYPEIKALWGYLFDKYELDIAFEGHYHHYLRTKPIYRAQPQPIGEPGTTHVMTIAIPNRERRLSQAPYVAAQLAGVPLYQSIEIDGDTLTCKAVDREGVVRDVFTLRK